MESGPANRDRMVPFLTVISTEFEKDLHLLRMILNQLEKRTHTEGGYRFSDRAEMAAGWWFYDIFVTPEFLQGLFQIALPREAFSSRNKKSATNRLVRMFEDQLRKNGSGAKIRMHGDVPFAAPWWAWLMK